ncbi:MAG: MarR family transcriptional regulator [Pseudomonadota bacterium]
MKITEDELVKGLAQAYLLMHRRVDRAMTKQGASLARTKLLLYIQKGAGAARAADVAELFDLAPRTVTQALDSLERDQLIIRSSDPQDRRVKRLTITPLGERAIAATEPLRKELLQEICAVLSDQDRVQLDDILRRLIGSLAEAGDIVDYR